MTDKNTYNADKDVRDFMQWVVKHAATLPISLNFKSTWAVPGGLRRQVTGLPGALANYVWKSEGTIHGNWAETGNAAGAIS